MTYTNITFNKYNIHAIIITSFTLAVIYNEDYYYSNLYYAQVGGINTKNLNKYIIKYCNHINYDLYVSPEEVFDTLLLYIKYKKY